MATAGLTVEEQKAVEVFQREVVTQFQGQSIPTVYAIFQGKPVADLTSARSESQLTGALDQLLEQLPVGGGAEPEQDVAPLLAMGEEVLGEGDAERAAGIFAQIADMAPDNVEAVGGLIRALVAADHIEQAEAALAGLPEELRSDPAIERAQGQTGCRCVGSLESGCRCQ